MESRIPLPTDNIYKFYALFGLLLIIFSLGARVAVNNNVWTTATTSAESAYAVLKLNPGNLSSIDDKRVRIYQQRIDSAIDQARTFRHLLNGLGSVGCLLLVFGFRQWHTKIQPVQDEMLQLQVEKLRREVAALAPVPSPAPPAVATPSAPASGEPGQSRPAGT